MSTSKENFEDNVVIECRVAFFQDRGRSMANGLWPATPLFGVV